MVHDNCQAAKRAAYSGTVPWHRIPGIVPRKPGAETGTENTGNSCDISATLIGRCVMGRIGVINLPYWGKFNLAFWLTT